MKVFIFFYYLGLQKVKKYMATLDTKQVRESQEMTKETLKKSKGHDYHGNNIK